MKVCNSCGAEMGQPHENKCGFGLTGYALVDGIYTQVSQANRTDEEIEFDERLEDAYWEREDEKNADDYLDDVFFESDFLFMYADLWEDTVDTRRRTDD